MKKILIIFFACVSVCLSSWAQSKGTTTSDEKQRIPIKPIVIEGEVSGVPDGTPVFFSYNKNKSLSYEAANGILADTVRNGKFHIEKRFIYKDFEDSEDNEKYSLMVNECGLIIYAYQGSTVKVTGTPDPEFLNWRTESNHPLQKELNEYIDHRRRNVANIKKKIREAYEADDVDDNLVQRLEREKDSIHVVSMLNFMKDRECDDVFVDEVRRISNIAFFHKNEELKGKIRDFIKEKVPTEYNDYQSIILSKQFLAPSSEYLHVGDKMMDFTFYDRDDKVRKLSEFVGKKPVVIQFSMKSCGACHAIRPEIEAFYAKHKDEVEIITISMDDEKTWKSDEKVSWQDWNGNASGSAIGTKFPLEGYPYYVIINSDGIISSTFLGNVELREYFKTFQQPQAQQSTTGNQAKLYSPTKDFTLHDRKGKEHKLSDFKGKYIVLMFTYEGCEPCLEAMPILDGFYKRNKDKAEVISISLDDKNVWEKGKDTVSFHEWYNYTDMHYYYGLETYFVIIHPNGNILHMSRYRLGSFFKELMEHVPDEEIKKLLIQKSKR